MNSDPLIVERALPDGQGVLLLKGPLTANNLHFLQNAIRREHAPTLILDLTEVPYIDSSGLGSLVAAYVSGHKAGQQLVLTGVNHRVANLLEITKLDQFFLIFPTIDDALEALSNSGQA